MHLFCILFIPLLFFLRRINSPGERYGLKGHDLEGRSLWALALGGLAVLVQYFFGPLLVPYEFGFSRWISGFVDITGLPALIPFMVCLLLVALKVFPAAIDYAGFALLWLAPLAVIQSISSPSGSSQSPISLVLVPILWAVQAVGVAFFISCIMRRPRRLVIVFSVLGIIALPIAATTSWWYFFGQRTLLGYLLLAVCLIPTAVYFIIIRNEELGVRNERREDIRKDERFEKFEIGNEESLKTINEENDELGKIIDEELEIKDSSTSTTS